MKTYLIWNEKLPDGSRYIVDDQAGMKKTIIDDSKLKPSGFKGYSIIEVDDDWEDFWYEDEE